MKSILFLIPTLGGGGAERVLVNLVNNLDKTKYDITLQTIFKAGVNRQFLDPSVKFIEGKVKQFTGNIHVMKLFTPTMLYRMIVGKQYDIVVSYLEGPTARIVSGCPYQDSKLISWIHVEQHTKQKASRSFRSVKEAFLCYDNFDHTVCVAETVKKDFLSIFNLTCPVSVLYNTNEDEKIKVLANEPVTDVTFSDQINIVSVGRLVPEKGFDRLIRVHRRLMDSGIISHVYLLGGGDSATYQRLIEENQVEKTFHLLGFKKNPYKYVAKADLFICSSNREGFSTSVTEALILGIPVVSTNVSGSTELLGDNNQYGIVTECSDDSLYMGMLQMLSNEETLCYYKQQAATRAKSFKKEYCIKAVEDLFDRLLEI